MDNLIEEELKQVIRRLDSIQKTLDLLYNDRNILEDIVTRIAQVENALNLNKTHQTDVQKDLKAEIRDVQIAAQDKVEEVKQAIAEKTVIVKGIQDGIFRRLLLNIKGVSK